MSFRKFQEQQFNSINHSFLASEITRQVLLPYDYFPDIPRTKTPWEKPKFKWYEILRIIFMIISGISIIRIFFALFLIFILWIITIPVTCGKPYYIEDPKPNSCFFVIYRFIWRSVFFCLGFHWLNVNYHGNSYEQIMKKEVGIVVANHIAAIDCMPLIILFNNLSLLGQRGLMLAPIIGRILRANFFIPCDRHTKDGKQLVKERMKDRASKAVIPFAVYPQGTTAPQNILTKFKWGPFLFKKNVMPVIMNFGNRYTEFSSVDHALGIFYTLTCFHNTCEINIYENYAPAENEIENPSLYASNVRQFFKDHMGPEVKFSEYCYDDHILQAHVQKVRREPVKQLSSIGSDVKFLGIDLPPLNPLKKIIPKYKNKDAARFTVSNICVSDLREQLGLEFDQIVELTNIFIKIDITGDGLINFEEFVDFLHLSKDSEVCKRLFQTLLFINKNENGVEIGFHEFSSLLAIIWNKSERAEAISLFWDLFQQNNIINYDILKLTVVSNVIPNIYNKKKEEMTLEFWREILEFMAQRPNDFKQEELVGVLLPKAREVQKFLQLIIFANMNESNQSFLKENFHQSTYEVIQIKVPGKENPSLSA